MSPLYRWESGGYVRLGGGGGTPPVGTPPNITTASLGPLALGVPASIPILYTGDPATSATLVGGDLPPGLDIVRFGGSVSIQGTPTSASMWACTIEIRNAAGADTQALAGTVAGGGSLFDRLDRGFGYTEAQARQRTGIARFGLTADDLEPYTGPYKVPANTNLEGYLISSPINLSNANVHLDRCLIRPTAPWYGWRIVGFSNDDTTQSPATRNSIRDSEISGELLNQQGQGLFTGTWGLGDIIGCDIHHAGSGIAVLQASGAYGVDILSNYVHNLTSYGNPATTGNHCDGFTIRGFAARTPTRQALIEANWFDCTTPNATGAAFIQCYESNVVNVRYEDNLFDGGGYNFQLESHSGGTYSEIRAVNNRFRPTGYGAAARNAGAPTEWANNFMYNPSAGPSFAGAAVSI